MDPTDDAARRRPAGPLSLHKAAAAGDDGPAPADVGPFRQGSPASRWALARYLVGRAIAESVGTALLIAGLVILALAALVGWAGPVFWAVLLAVVAFAVLAMRAVLLAVLRRLTGGGRDTAGRRRLRALVADTRGDVLRELRRVGLPGRTLSLPLLGLRLARRRTRTATLERLREFDVDRAVPAARLDEVHLLLRADGAGPGGWTAPGQQVPR